MVKTPAGHHDLAGDYWRCFGRDIFHPRDLAHSLRAYYSVESATVEKVLAGTTLQVVGRFNRWLKIDRNGNQVWMADWVSYTRVEDLVETTPTQPQTASNIDNCCFVDRQCSTDQEWRDGYWAFQENECAAPTQSRQQTSSPEVAGHAVNIEGSQLFVNLISEALDLLRSRSRKWYDYVISGTDRIIEDENHYSMAAVPSQRLVLSAPYGRHITVFNHEVNVLRVVSGLVHEACHIHRYEAGFEYGPYTKIKEELACIQLENEMGSVVAPNPPEIIHSAIGPSHCEGSLENYRLCILFEKNLYD